MIAQLNIQISAFSESLESTDQILEENSDKRGAEWEGGSWGIEGERGAGKDLNEKDTTIKEKGRSFP